MDHSLKGYLFYNLLQQPMLLELLEGLPDFQIDDDDAANDEVGFTNLAVLWSV